MFTFSGLISALLWSCREGGIAARCTPVWTFLVCLVLNALSIGQICCFYSSLRAVFTDPEKRRMSKQSIKDSIQNNASNF